MNATFKQETLSLTEELCKDIAKSIAEPTDSSRLLPGYTSQRIVIKQLFEKTGGENYTRGSVMLRLTVIDSLYSTNAAYSYFAIDELAEAIFHLGTENAAADYFYSIVCGGEDTQNLFSKSYGIRKNLGSGGRLISLASKYAYYSLLQDPQRYPLGFPIYDSLVIKMLPVVNEHLGISSGKFEEKKIVPFVAAVNAVRIALLGNNATLFHGFQPFDALDIYLWRMGKINGGNYSLLLDKTDYKTFIENLGVKSKPTTGFNADTRDCCSIKPLADIVRGTSNKPLLQAMIEHWRKYFITKL